MTVCTAALCHGGRDVVGTYDCMITYGDLQFEAPEQKAIPVDKGVLVLTAGDGDTQTEIITKQKVLLEEHKASGGVVSVPSAARLYQEAHTAIWQQKAERVILSKQSLTYESYVTKQKKLSERLVGDLAAQLARFKLPHVEAIITGVDDTGGHIQFFHYDEDLEDYDLKSRDSCGYACIGSGARLAEAVFIINQYTPNQALTNALFTCYAAKKRSELATGVGERTRIFKIVPEELKFFWDHPFFTDLIHKTYKEMVEKISTAQEESREYIKQEVQNAAEEVKKQIPVEPEEDVAQRSKAAVTSTKSKGL